MAEYIVSARKYRPDTFKTVVGQESITTTLKNSISTKHLAHAYLFCGPRGVGKTTCARIFAKTINCFHPTENIEPCDECESCKGFNRTSSFNIHELDAASNNSVDGMRNLIDQVRIPPQLGKYNVYIIDEVHMLSNQAFNTFLKTLEEPPAHAIFILATTEKQKIIPTILSRCQIFDFNRIKINDIVGHLQFVAKSENINAEPEALNIIAQKADGAMRDALSIFDQIVSFCGTEITYSKVIETLNVLDYDYYFKLTDNFISGNIAQSLMLFNEILSKGFEAQYFIIGLSSHFRDLLVCKDETTLQLLEVGKAIAERYRNQASKLSADFIYKALEISNQCDLNYRLSHNKRLLVELTLVKICNLSVVTTNITKQTNPTTLKSKENIEQQKSTVEKKEASIINNKNSELYVKKEQQRVNAEIYLKPKGYDITEILKPKINNVSNIPNEINEPVNNAKLNKSFTNEELKDTWLKYSETKKSIARVHQFLLTNIPTISANNLIIVPAINKSQEDEIKKLHDELLVYLKKNLENDFITIKIELTENTETNSTKPYTDAEKYQYFAQKNPDLQTLRDKLNLDFEH
ncbi:MAG: DNA polymerase III subunit gamma/tau [Bacteroidetes bacterium CG02_land_8_20_14_3_00_31_25]|nr:DNA polymerase III subunit gamma/tau [Bacteroidota bacterium]PIV58510.1 MAG: DNA polymerase III subunit gamma/tau [Bacteroidetes bacterium CG02_land_8_20_14_3_00_31_25]PIX32989.1 MAG: DNA polymerase III subunit gamma/tau [Bacteroidetes bacterium CG_4_8_14_3_um_filter_31_14]PIY02683.1 MAG: DNA polymerase III subunit gamma/tau [Bacteroidetes bacterium CG_4_10_14_3_um_filter_31_20]